MQESNDVLFHRGVCLACGAQHVVGANTDTFSFVDDNREIVFRSSGYFDDRSVLKLWCPNCRRKEVVVKIDSMIIFVAGRIFERKTPVGRYDKLN